MIYFKELKLQAKRAKVSEAEESYRVSIATPLDVADLCRRILTEDKEVFLVIPVDVKNRPLGFVTAGAGGIDSCPVDPREVFRTAIHLGASAVVLAHNHPSGDTEPSQEDTSLTKRLIDGGRLLGIDILDHLIVTEDGHCSLREEKAGLWA